MTAGLIDNVKFTSGSTIIYIAVINVKENWTNAITALTIPTMSDTPNISSIINLNKVEDRFTITGYICGGKLHSSETYTSAYDKKENFKTIFGKGAVVAMTYEGTNYNVAVDKYEIAYKAMDDVTTTRDGVAIYDVVISCIRGVDLI